MSSSLQGDRNELELLAGLVLGDLSADEHEQAKPVLSRNQFSETIWELEKTAAGVQLAFLNTAPDEMPSDVADRIRHAGRQVILEKQSGDDSTTRSPADPAVAGQATSVASPGGPKPSTEAKPAGGMSLREIIPWLCTAAALLLAVGLWIGPGEPASPSLAELRAELISQSNGVIQVDWVPGKTPFEAPVSGDVVWDGKSQRGFMRFENLPPNDPKQSQYQLWIIDPMRDDEPVDGGVFDVSETGEVIVPIDAKLNVVQPAAFAITVEKPGGVVVSTQENLPLLAPVPEPAG
ncbi:MAG: anti-sigma factor [Planctomycetota bacterium]